MLGLGHDVNASRVYARERARHVEYDARTEREACADKNSRRGFFLVPRYLDIGQRLLSERRRRENREVRGEIASDSPHQNKGGVLPDAGDDPLGLSLFAPGRGALACGPATQVCIRIAQAAMNSPAGQAVQRAAQQYGQRAVDLARRYGPRVADAASRLGSWLIDKVGGAKAPNLTVTFGRNANQIEHAFRHTDKLGLSRTAVQEAVQKHLPSVVDKIPSGSPLNQVIEVGGKQIQYSAFRLPDGSINVGRIHGVP